LRYSAGMFSRRSLDGIVIATLVIACQSSESEPRASGPGAGGTGGASGSAGNASAAGSGSSGKGATAGAATNSCPNALPATDASCSDEGLTCSYAGSPCGTTARCDGGTWSLESTCPPEDECPVTLPDDGDPCTIQNPISGPLVCHFGQCPAGTIVGPLYQASCDDTSWSITELDCPPAVECGECPPGESCGAYCMPGQTCGRNQCPVGQVCMRMQYAGGNWTWDCAVNNCEPGPLDCSCVGAVCEQRALPGDWQCTATDDSTITCDCASGC
jgi:hypothetical protein